VGIVCVVIVLLIVGLLSDGGKSKSPAGTSTQTDTSAKHQTTHDGGTPRASGTSTGATSVVALSLRATGTVYICLIGENGKRLIDGQTLEAGTRTPTFHAKRFELTLGNNAVALAIDGTPRTVPASSGAIGYTITKAGRKTLAEGHLPTCT
jgi:hypothetical protein